MMKITKLQLVRGGRVTEILKNVKSSAITEESGSVNLPGTQTTEAAASDSNIGGSPFFAVYGVNVNGKEVELSFEAPAVEIARKWVKALDHLTAFARHLNQFHGEDTMQMHSNPLYNIIRAEKKFEIIEDAIEENLRRTEAMQQQASGNVHDRLSAVLGEDYAADLPPPTSDIFKSNGNFCEEEQEY